MKKEKFFLVTSSIKSLFPLKKNNILLIGEWCKTNLSNNFLKKYKLKTFSHHWENDKKKIKDYKYILKVYHKTCYELTILLNKIHQKNFSRKYWEQIIGPWLIQFVVIIYDRYYLTKQIGKYNIDETYCLDNYNYTFIPKDYRESIKFYQSDLWNNYIFSILISRLNSKVKIKKISSKNTNHTIEFIKENHTFSKKRNYKSKIINIFSFLTSRLRKKKEIFIINSYLKFIQEISLQIKSNNLLKFNNEISHNKKFIVSKSLRKVKFNKKKDDKFCSILKELIIKNIPTSYLEGYSDLVNFSEKLPWPTNPKKIYASNNQISDEVFKIWLAGKKEKNIPFIAGQHGGGYLIAKYATMHDWDVKNCDNFLFWGKKKFKNPKIIPSFNIKCNGNFFKRNNSCYEILIIQDFPLRYEMRLDSTQFPFSGFKKNIEFQYKFIKNLNNENYKNLKIRLGSYHYSAAQSEEYEKNLWKNKDNDLKLESRKIPIKESVKNSSIIICTTISSTAFLESLSSNVPCFIFVDYKQNCISQECRKDFAKLKQVGILQNNPYKFSKLINKYSNNINVWWNSKNVQKTVNKFKEKYTLVEKKPVLKLSQILKQDFKLKNTTI